MEAPSENFEVASRLAGTLMAHGNSWAPLYHASRSSGKFEGLAAKVAEVQRYLGNLSF
jgi:hypothetical protein